MVGFAHCFGHWDRRCLEQGEHMSHIKHLTNTAEKDVLNNLVFLCLNF